MADTIVEICGPRVEEPTVEERPLSPSIDDTLRTRPSAYPDGEERTDVELYPPTDADATVVDRCRPATTGRPIWEEPTRIQPLYGEEEEATALFRRGGDDSAELFEALVEQPDDPDEDLDVLKLVLPPRPLSRRATRRGGGCS